MIIKYNKTPILIIAWKRPDKIEKLINSLKIIRPKTLYFSCDGPKTNENQEAQKIYQTRKIIKENVDWECTIKKKFNKFNVGCKRNMIDSINWIFKENDRAIILEDDCIPKPEFFKFCYLLLIKYESDSDIWSINGTNLQNGKIRGKYDYYFSKYFHSWGWATWKDRWNKIDENLDSYEKFKDLRNINNFFINGKEKKYWLTIWERLKYENEPDSWAYRWLYSSISNNGLNITPNINLINNIGFDEDATNTKIKINNFFKKDNSHIIFNNFYNNHPEIKVIDSKADKYTFNNYFKISFFRKIIIIIINPKYYLNKLFSLIVK